MNFVKDDQKAVASSIDIHDPSLVFLYAHLQKTYKALRIEEVAVSLQVEAEFYKQCAQSYGRFGCPELALRILQRSPIFTIDRSTIALKAVGISGTSENNSFTIMNDNSNLDWGEPVSGQKTFGLDLDPHVQKSDAFDWGAPTSVQIEDDYDSFKNSLFTAEDSNFEEDKPASFISEPLDKIAVFFDDADKEYFDTQRRQLVSYKWSLAMSLIQVSILKFK